MGKANLRVTYCGVKLVNPFLLASSPVTDSQEMVARGFETGWAGAVLKTTTHPDEENSIAYPMMAGLEPGNHLVGLHNTDLLSDRYIDEMCEQLVWLKTHFPDRCVGLSIMGTTRDQWEELVQKASQAGADLIEASISCPQGSMVEGDEQPDGSMISQDARLTEKVTRWAKAAAGKIPVVVKLSPGVTDISQIARAVKQGGGMGSAPSIRWKELLGSIWNASPHSRSCRGLAHAAGIPVGLSNQWRCVALQISPEQSICHYQVWVVFIPGRMLFSSCCWAQPVCRFARRLCSTDLGSLPG